MSIILDTILSWPPSTNNYIGNKGKKYYLTRRVREYRKVIDNIIHTIYNFLPPDVTDKVKLTLAYLPPSHRRYDTSNFIKQLEDALMHAHLIKDDSQIYEHKIYKFNKQSDISGVYTLMEHFTAADERQHQKLLATIKSKSFVKTN